MSKPAHKSAKQAFTLRTFWAALLIGHLPLLANSVITGIENPLDPGSFASIVVLLLTVGFFAAKAADVAWLRLADRKKSLIAFLLITAIAHHDVVAPDSNAAPALIVAATAPLLGEKLWRRRRLILRRVRSLISCLRPSSPILFGQETGVYATLFLRRLLDAQYRQSPPRGPPAPNISMA